MREQVDSGVPEAAMTPVSASWRRRIAWRWLGLFALAALSPVAMSLQATLVQHGATQLRPVHVTHRGGASARFAGRTWIAGTIVGHWPGPAGRHATGSPVILLIPDRDAAARLPHFVVRDPPYFLRYRVEAIELFNGTDTLAKMVGTTRVRRLLSRRVDAVEAKGEFLIEAYAVGIECDAPWAQARVVNIRRPARQAATRSPIPESC